MTLRILQMADVEPDPDSGASGTDIMGAAALRSAGHEVCEVWTDELSQWIRHYNLRYLLELPYEYRRQVARRLREQRFDVVQISTPQGFLAAKYVMAAHPDVVFVHRSHGFEPSVADALKPWRGEVKDMRTATRRAASNVLSALLQRNINGIARYATGHLVSASPCADYLHDKFNVPRERIGVVPQGLPPTFELAPPCMNEERGRRLLYVGQYAFVKAPQILGKAVSALLRARSELTFTWVCAQTHHAQAGLHFSEDVRARVTMLDWMSQDKLRSVYDGHGIFLFPSFYEGFGKAFLEAMSRGLVVFASDTGGMRDIIKTGRNGFRVPVGDAGELTSAIESLLDAPQQMGLISGRAIETANRHSWSEFAHRVTAFYGRLLDARRTGGST